MEIKSKWDKGGDSVTANVTVCEIGLMSVIGKAQSGILTANETHFR